MIEKMRNKMEILPIIIDSTFGLGVDDELKFACQDWFVSFSDFFGSPAIWVKRKSYKDALSFMDANNYSILCV